MRDYREAYESFSMAALEQETLSGGLSSGVNACIECCDRWASADKTALHWVSRDLTRHDVSFADLRRDAARFANLLRSRGIGPGDVVAGLLPKVPELLTVILGTWRAGAIYQALFTAFGPDAIASRMTGPGGSGAKLVVTDAINRPKLDQVPHCPPALMIDRGAPGATAFATEMAAQADLFQPVMRLGHDPFIMIYTSGTTGSPKGVRMPHAALLQFAESMHLGFGVAESDTFWCMADPGWALGLYLGVTGPLLIGKPVVLYDGPFTVDSTVRVIAELGVTNFVTAPTALRLMRAAGDAAVAPIAHRLRVISAGGEAVSPEIVRWANATLHCPVHEVWGQTEMGVTTYNHVGLRQENRIGSVGTASRGFAFAILNDELNPVPDGEVGVMAVDRARSPLFFFDGYWRTTNQPIHGNWYLTGDTMQRDGEGYYHFVGRNDDLITSSGYRIGPSDIEDTILSHPSVAEVAVVGRPDPERTEIVKAFVVLRAGWEASDALVGQYQQLVRERLAAHAYPREVAFMSELPKTPSGKVQRFVLRRMETPARVSSPDRQR
ncbi:MAG TPA: AMP-binding protein [Acetobacteraceae bacterium]|nr:AMP-binding protein [Acetobacteraceae bacterium]